MRTYRTGLIVTRSGNTSQGLVDLQATLTVSRQHRLNEAVWNALEEIGERQPDGSIVIDLTDLDKP